MKKLRPLSVQLCPIDGILTGVISALIELESMIRLYAPRILEDEMAVDCEMPSFGVVAGFPEEHPINSKSPKNKSAFLILNTHISRFDRLIIKDKLKLRPVQEFYRRTFKTITVKILDVGKGLNLIVYIIIYASIGD